ncbi:hypothetical protein HAX54_021822 [Datura stramonium]|uniref:Uncharacterized protein n=1 Tax=Datura stramonium TaxID=4076 RepID=A0ABS8S4F4_DATST|nr:hypothetical protein [Datura stramonium]
MGCCISQRTIVLARGKKIAKRRQLRDESELDSSSGSEVHYNITSSDESPVVTTRENSKAQEAVAATTSLPQSDEGSDEDESDGDNPPADNAEKGNDDVVDSGDYDTNAEESGDKNSVAEESNEKVDDSEPATTPEARSKRWFLQGSIDVYFVGLNLNEKGNPSVTLGKYSMEMVREFYEKYYCTLEKKASSKKAIKKEPVLDSVRVRAIPVDT